MAFISTCSTWLISIKSVQYPFCNNFMVDASILGWNRSLNVACCVGLDVALYTKIIALPLCL